MKISNWCKKLSTKLVAAGVLLPSAAYAVDIPLGDPSFEDYNVPAFNAMISTSGYAYSDLYRPTSAWVDDLTNPLSPPYAYFVDDGSSNWLYDAGYAEKATLSRRGSPRTGDQAMHGGAHYSAQVISDTFEANHTYTFSLWAQNDEILDGRNGLFMYIFNGDENFDQPSSLADLGGAFTAINQRQPGMSAADSKNNWTLVTLPYYVAPGAPEIGHRIGVGFFSRVDTAVDDASLSAVPEPCSVFLVGAGLGGLMALRRKRRT